jgi:hypothetical protein
MIQTIYYSNSKYISYVKQRSDEKDKIKIYGQSYKKKIKKYLKKEYLHYVIILKKKLFLFGILI